MRSSSRPSQRVPGHVPARPFRRRLLRPGAAGLLGLGVVAASLSPGWAGPTHQEPTTLVSSASAQASPALTVKSFAQPAAGVRPKYRFWVPLAYTEDDVLRDQLKQVKDVGGGGVEVVPFIVPGAGNQTNAFLAEYGFGTPRWAHKVEVITQAAADLGLTVDLNLGPHYPPTVPTLNSFNQPEAEQQLIYGREFNAAGSSRAGTLPAPTTAPPSVTTTLCAAADAGASTIGVANLGGLAAGDTITVGTGAGSERVTVTKLGDRTAACGQLGVSRLAGPHAVGESLLDVARTTRLRTLVAQCVTACDASTTGPVSLVNSSVVDVTKKVKAGELSYAFPAGNGNPWVVIDFQQTASGLTGQRNGFTATQPNYVVDHWNSDGVRIQADFWDQNILTKQVRSNLRRIGSGAVFEDSLELGTTQKWTWDFLKQFQSRRGYDLSTLLPALAGVGVQGTGKPAFELAGDGPKVREDYRQTLSDLYVDDYVTPMQRWARSRGLDFRVQAYGTPIATAVASAAAGIPEGESLNFGDPNPVGAEQSYRVVAAGAHLSGGNVVSVECCANFFGNYRSSVAGPNVGGGYTAGGDGTQVGGKYSQGNLDSINKAYAGGVNQLVWHGLPYRDAPGGGTTGGQGGTWPGYNPWDIFNALNASESYGPRQASWADYKAVNDNLARTQLVLRQGRATLDLGVYYEDLGLAGESVSAQQSPQHQLGNDSATSSNGYTSEYVAPAFLNDRKLKVERDGGLFGDSSDLKALVLNDQRTMSLENARRLMDLTQDGLRLFVVGQAPQAATGVDAEDPDGTTLARTVTALLNQKSVTKVATEAELPAALKKAGILPTVAPATPTTALGLVHRQADGTTYDYVYNRSARTVTQNLTLTGKGQPYRLDTWTGQIVPLTQYQQKGNRITVPVRIAPYDKVVIALTESGARLGAAAAAHADTTSSGTEVTTTGDRRPALRATTDGRYETTVAGRSQVTTVSGLAGPQTLTDWALRAQTWSPGENQYTTVKTDQPPVTLTAGTNGKLPAWLDLKSPVDLSQASGVGTYQTQLTLPSTWRAGDGAYLSLGDVLDTARVSVNGKAVTVNQSDRGRIDLGQLLKPGANTLTVTVATTMFNAVRATGDSNYQTPAWQRTGLMGPVVLQPYRDTTLTAPR